MSDHTLWEINEEEPREYAFDHVHTCNVCFADWTIYRGDNGEVYQHATRVNPESTCAHMNYAVCEQAAREWDEEHGDVKPPAKEVTYQVCPQCHGHGKMVARYASVWTGSDRAEDPDGFEYMLSGGYDTACDRCHGMRVVTDESEEQFRGERADHYEMLREQGIGPGHRDWY